MTLRTRLSVLLAAVAALFSVAVGITTTSAAAADEAGPFQIANYSSGLCLDVSGGSTSDGARIQQWNCNRTDAQKWHLKVQYSCDQPACRFTLIPHVDYNRNPQGCLTNPDWSTSAGQDMQVGSCAPSPWASTNQGFSLAVGSSAFPTPGAQFRYHFIEWFGGMCLEVENGSDNRGAAVQQAPCDGSLKQLWIVTT